MAVTTSALAPVCAWVTLSPTNRAITKSEIHNTRYFAFIVVLLFASPLSVLPTLSTTAHALARASARAWFCFEQIHLLLHYRVSLRHLQRDVARINGHEM